MILKRGRLALLLVFFSVVPILPLPALAAEVTLTWDAITDGRVQGYTVRYRKAIGDICTPIPVGNAQKTVPVGNETSCTVTGLDPDTLYCFSVSGYGGGAESPFCDEVPYTPRCTYALSSRSASYASSGGAGSVTVSAATGCTWNSSTPPSWLNLTSGATGSGTGSVVYSIAPNTDANPRSASLTIADQTFTVTQAGLVQYTITTLATTGGIIVPSISVVVPHGSDQAVYAVAYPGYQIGEVTVDGVPVNAMASWFTIHTFIGVTSDHTLTVAFTPG